MTHANASKNIPWRRLLGVVLGIAIIALLWKVTPLSEYATPNSIRSLLETLRGSPWAVSAAMAIYTVGTLALFPHMAMTASIVLVFPPVEAFSICMTGSLVSGSIGYGVGRMFGMKSLKALVGQTAEKISGYAKQGGILGITLLRLLPLAPYTVVNIALAMLETPFLIFIAGTFLGTLPGTLIASILGFSAMELWKNPNPENMALIGLGLAAWIGVIAASHLANRFLKRRRMKGLS